MTRISEKRGRVIYGAVYDRFMDLRVELSRSGAVTREVDEKIAKAATDAAQAALSAAQFGTYERTWRPTPGETK